jgi:hypothetical protein
MALNPPSAGSPVAVGRGRLHCLGSGHALQAALHAAPTTVTNDPMPALKLLCRSSAATRLQRDLPVSRCQRSNSSGVKITIRGSTASPPASEPTEP